jgi:AraC family cel operon transcriptional repressor
VWSRIFYRPGDAYPFHSHEFAEFFWIEDGTLRHRCDHGEHRMDQGMIALIHPDRRHALEPWPGHHCVLVNVTIAPEVLERLHQRYGPWWHLAPDRPWHHRLSAADLQALQAWIEILGSGAPSILTVDAFLCDLLRRLERQTESSPLDVLPEWLRDALEACREPPQLSQGLAALVHLTGRSREYIARLLRQQCNTSPTELLNGMRMRYAAERLRLGDETVTDLAADCGYTNLTHFYRLFKAAYGCTPKGYRLQARQAASGNPLPNSR